MTVSVFVCGVKKDKGKCSSPGCGLETSHVCSFALGGKKKGTTCGRFVCETHAGVLRVGNKNFAHCLPHRELVLERQQEKRRIEFEQEMFVPARGEDERRQEEEAYVPDLMNEEI